MKHFEQRALTDVLQASTTASLFSLDNIKPTDRSKLLDVLVRKDPDVTAGYKPAYIIAHVNQGMYLRILANLCISEFLPNNPRRNLIDPKIFYRLPVALQHDVVRLKVLTEHYFKTTSTKDVIDLFSQAANSAQIRIHLTNKDTYGSVLTPKGIIRLDRAPR